MQFNSFSGGISKSKYQGVKGSWYELVGVDIHSEPGIIKLSQALKKDSGDTVTELVKNIVVNPNTGDAYFFSSESGKIWKRTSDGTWSLAHTNTNGACLGAGYHPNGYILFATASKLGKYDFTTWTDSYADFANADTSFHPMAFCTLSVFIGDGNQLAAVDNTNSFSDNVLDIRTHLRISALAEFQDDLIIGNYVSGYHNSSSVIRWNGYDDSWNYSDPIGEPVNCFIQTDNRLFFQAGNNGAIYYYNGYQSQLYGYLRSETSITASEQFFNRGLIGGTQGVWSLASFDKDYPQVFSVEYSPSIGQGATIGAIKSYGSNIFVAWKKDSTAGVDVIDTANKSEGYFTTMEIKTQSVIKEISVDYDDLPTGTSITFYTKVNNGDWTEETSVVDSTKRQVKIARKLTNVRTLQVKTVLNSSGNSTPKITSLNIV